MTMSRRRWTVSEQVARARVSRGLRALQEALHPSTILDPESPVTEEAI
jgi:hypothetical protein